LSKKQTVVSIFYHKTLILFLWRKEGAIAAKKKKIEAEI